jgi:hypothetical protein
MCGFFMNMHKKLPTSLTNAEREYLLKTNEIFKHEISILNGVKLKLEKIIPNELLTIIMNTIAAPPAAHGRYIPDITEEEMTTVLLENNSTFVDLNILESSYYRTILLTSISPSLKLEETLKIKEDT